MSAARIDMPATLRRLRHATRGSPRWLRPLQPVTLLVTVAFLTAGWARRWNGDDAFIVFRVVDNVLAGHGPVFNIGERVEAVTSPLWLAILVVARSGLPVPAEWLAVIIGLLLAVVGLVFAMAGADLLSQRDDGRLVPAGALLWLGLPPAWDYATSGLDSGLGTAWLGLCCWSVARLAIERSPAGTPVAVAVVIGLGPVIRPDFGVFSVVFGLAVAVLCAGRGMRTLAGLLAAAIAVPLTVEVARAGYYATLVPTTLLAKEATTSNWPQGWWYLVDFVAPYALGLPLAAVGWLAVTRAFHDGDRRRRIARLAPIVGGVVYGVAVVRGGGDFMHARMLLPSVFALLAPVALVRMRSATDSAAIAMLTCWAVLSAVALRAPAASERPAVGISDQRAFYVEKAAEANPVTLDDFREYARVTRGLRAARLAAGGRRTLIVDEQLHPLAADAQSTVVYEAGAVGLASAAAGPQVYVLDRLGLGDPYTARQRLEQRRRPGHDKPLPLSWVWGRYGAVGSVPPDQAAAAGAVRHALACAPLRELDRAISDPLTPRRFLDNLIAAPRLTQLRFPSRPRAAVETLCRAGGLAVHDGGRR